MLSLFEMNENEALLTINESTMTAYGEMGKIRYDPKTKTAEVDIDLTTEVDKAIELDGNSTPVEKFLKTFIKEELEPLVDKHNDLKLITERANELFRESIVRIRKEVAAELKSVVEKLIDETDIDICCIKFVHYYHNNYFYESDIREFFGLGSMGIMDDDYFELDEVWDEEYEIGEDDA